MLGGYLRILGTHSPVSPYRYLLPTVYLFMADIGNPDLAVCSCRIWICLDITHFSEYQRQPCSGPAWPAFKKKRSIGHPLRGRQVSTQFAQQSVTAVTAPPLVGCVVWSHYRCSAITLPRPTESVKRVCCLTVWATRVNIQDLA